MMFSSVGINSNKPSRERREATREMISKCGLLFQDMKMIAILMINVKLLKHPLKVLLCNIVFSFQVTF